MRTVRRHAAPRTFRDTCASVFLTTIAPAVFLVSALAASAADDQVDPDFVPYAPAPAPSGLAPTGER